MDLKENEANELQRLNQPVISLILCVDLLLVITFFINSFSVRVHWIYAFVFVSLVQTRRSCKFTPCSCPCAATQFLEAIFLAFHQFWHFHKSKWR